MAHDHDAADGLAFAVPLGDAPSHFGTDSDPGHVLQENGRSVAVNAQRDLADVFDRLDRAETPDHEFLLGEFEGPAADVGVAGFDRGADPRDRNAVGAKPVGIHRNLVLLDEAADAGDLGDTGHARQFVLQKPILDGSQFAEVVVVRGEGVHECPAHPGRVRAERGRHTLRQLTGGVA